MKHSPEPLYLYILSGRIIYQSEYIAINRQWGKSLHMDRYTLLPKACWYLYA